MLVNGKVVGSVTDEGNVIDLHGKLLGRVACASSSLLVFLT